MEYSISIVISSQGVTVSISVETSVGWVFIVVLNRVGLSDERSSHTRNGVIEDDILMELLPVIIFSIVALDLTSRGANYKIILQVVVPCVISLCLGEEASIILVIIVGIHSNLKVSS